jgi:hypothetical protein
MAATNFHSKGGEVQDNVWKLTSMTGLQFLLERLFHITEEATYASKPLRFSLEENFRKRL